MHEQPIAKIMNESVQRVLKHAPVRYVIELMNKYRQSCVVIVEGKRPLGVVTERDIVRMLAIGKVDIETLRADKIMSAPAVTISDMASIEECLILTQARKLRHLVAVNAAGDLVGTVNQSDLLRAYLADIRHIDETVNWEVKQRTAILEQTNKQLLNLAMEDALLGIGNRRAMEVDLAHTQSAAQRFGDTYHIALFDIDFFKKYNDTYGHQAGDDALKQIAQVLSYELRETDRLYRYGGEELLLLMPKVSLDQAVKIADRAREAVQAAGIEHSGSDINVLTVSAGVAAGDANNWQKGIKQADNALYQAKHQGRNCVVAAE